MQKPNCRYKHAGQRATICTNVQIEGQAASGLSRSNAGLGFDLHGTFDDESILDFLEADLGVILHCFRG